MSSVQLYHGDALDVLRSLPDASVDAVITDPPYPEIDRPYGRLTEAEWHSLMRCVVAECRRLLKPHGSAVFVLQPNSEKIGRMRPWLWEFMAWTAREWNMVQDAWWWNMATMPQACTIHGKLLRPSLKACVWLGEPDCFRNQDEVFWIESQSQTADRLANRLNADREYHPSGHSVNRKQMSQKSGERGGVTPFNVLPIGNTDSTSSAGAHGHGAGTPLPLCQWWTRYIAKPGGVVLDMFAGSGTTGIAAVQHGCDYIGIEKEESYYCMALKRVNDATAQSNLFAET